MSIVYNSVVFLSKTLFGLGRLTTVNPITGPVEIQVNASDAESARRLLAELITEVEGE